MDFLFYIPVLNTYSTDLGRPVINKKEASTSFFNTHRG